MRNIRTIMVVATLCAATIFANAQKPQWVGNTPQELNHTYKFVEVVSHGNTLESARLAAKDQLTDSQQLLEGIRINRSTTQQTNIDKQRINGGKLQETKHDKIVVNLTVDGEQFNLQANKVDEYYTKEQGEYKLYTLYQVATCEEPVFDNTYLSTSYGTKPAFMSVIPGLGQWYKGSKVKGACMFAAEAAAVTSLLVCENQRSSYRAKMIEQPKFAKDYKSKADNWESSRNICIGVAAGIWIYNIIDAAVAKGARRVVVKRNGGGLSMNPYAMPDGSAGVSFAYKF